ncbi:Rv1355c family protein [Algoriphagus sp.]|uniref:Rv1355c family protein n=1 Tax=Algoriphagus sp. TaxID=1872435 RepID=UPI002718794E|nr:Rv1355c family protein [Algoriphagus sp.]MDO8968660.1 Rv1355c family protein [Algoriphagus sp.]MDP3200318.1 Rv1355c family protein [Algoriphagus sp.]
MLTYSKSDLGDQVYPVFYNPSDQSDLEKIQNLKSNSFIYVVDEIDSQVSDLIKSQSPEYQFSKEELQERVSDFFRDKDKERFGNWVYYPWKYTLVHLLPENDFIKVRTVRNNYKITPEEQQELAKKKIGIVGLSVGQSVALAMALERSCGEMRLADFDTLELSNLNRIKAGVTSLGVEKLIIAAREISDIDPYLKVTLFREGITEENIDRFITENGKLDLIIEECDSFDIKILVRQKAKKYQVAVMMDTSDRGMLDIERFDLEPEREIFHGLLGNVELNSLKNLTSNQRIAFGLKITGLETLSPRMKASLLEVGQSISSWPQLASAVFLGGASIAHVGRRVLLGDSVNSGRFYVDLDQIVPTEYQEFNINIPAKSIVDSHFLIPNNVMPSGYLLSKNEVIELVNQANLAPSGGNIQPWIWVFDKKGNLHLFHDQKRSHSLLDYKGIGSLFAFGAALENLRLAAAKKGIEIEIIQQIKNFEEDLIVSIRFLSKVSKEILVPFGELYSGIAIRNTNRKNNGRIPLEAAHFSQLLEITKDTEFELETISMVSELEQLAKVIGGMDRLRLFHEQGLSDFISEVRWSENEAKETKDGIDIATLELSSTERAAMGLLKDPRTVRFFRKFLMGYGLTKISKETITSSSAMFLLSGKEFIPKTYLESGKVVQRIWLWANMNGMSFQPVTASLFIFRKVLDDPKHGFKEHEVNEIHELKRAFNLLFNKELKMLEIFMFRLNFAGEPSVRSYRRDVIDTLKFID